MQNVLVTGAAGFIGSHVIHELLKTNKYTDKQISEITGLPIRSFIAKIRRKETWRYLTKNINQPLGKAERKTFTY